jgi:hypothetical protein
MISEEGREDQCDKRKREIFASFHYGEIKDLAKHFLTLISGTLVFSVTFAEKIVPITKVTMPQKLLLGGCWVVLLASIFCAGLGLYVNYLAAEKAQGGIIYNHPKDYRTLARFSYSVLDLSAMLYGVALVLLAATAMTRLFI